MNYREKGYIDPHDMTLDDCVYQLPAFVEAPQEHKQRYLDVGVALIVEQLKPFGVKHEDFEKLFDTIGTFLEMPQIYCQRAAVQKEIFKIMDLSPQKLVKMSVGTALLRINHVNISPVQDRLVDDDDRLLIYRGYHEFGQTIRELAWIFGRNKTTVNEIVNGPEPPGQTPAPTTPIQLHQKEETETSEPEPLVQTPASIGSNQLYRKEKPDSITAEEV